MNHLNWIRHEPVDGDPSFRADALIFALRVSVKGGWTWEWSITLNEELPQGGIEIARGELFIEHSESEEDSWNYKGEDKAKSRCEHVARGLLGVGEDALLAHAPEPDIEEMDEDEFAEWFKTAASDEVTGIVDRGHAIEIFRAGWKRALDGEYVETMRTQVKQLREERKRWWTARNGVDRKALERRVGSRSDALVLLEIAFSNAGMYGKDFCVISAAEHYARISQELMECPETPSSEPSHNREGKLEVLVLSAIGLRTMGKIVTDSWLRHAHSVLGDHGSENIE